MTTTTPQTHGSAAVVASLTRALIVEADAAHVGFAQYAGYFDAWTPVEVTKRVQVKGRVAAFLPGDVVLAQPAGERHAEQLAGFTTCWSRRTGWNTSVPTGSIRPVLVDDKPRCLGCGHPVAGPEYVNPDPDLPCPTR